MRPSPPNKPEQPAQTGVLGRVRRWFGFGGEGQVRAQDKAAGTGRPSLTHVVIMDGTMSRMDEGHRTNAGQAAQLLRMCCRGAGSTGRSARPMGISRRNTAPVTGYF